LSDEQQWQVQLVALRKLLAALSERGHRDDAFRDWIHRIPLLVAPESGLSTKIASLILDQWKILQFPFDPQALKTLRLERLRDSGHSDGHARSMLAEIDAESPDDHPWFKEVGRSSQER
jgi:hypothetical protein